MPPLATEVTGEGPRLVMAHGFTQTGRLWGPIAEVLGDGRSLVRVDLPGHAGSSAVAADLEAGGALLLEAGGDGPFDLLGYSLGARFALHAALARPDRVRRLVLIGVTAGIEDPRAREERRRRDEAVADDLERTGDLEGFLRRWLASPMFSSLGAPGLAERLRNTPGGLASSLRLAGTGTQRPRWDDLGGLAVPTLLLAGTDDARFAAAAVRMAGLIPDAVASLVPGAGHAAHLHQPALCARLVGRFLDAD
jgi:2-succinyl-6-hydroxy-2,4-cyclohexadiene-1-carboxylate synthase